MGKRHRQSGLTAVIEALECRRFLSVDVLAYRGGTSSTGVNASETQLTPANVNTSDFGKLYSTTLDGQVYAQPLVETGVTIAKGVNTAAGAAGVHDVVFVATENDSLYAIDANSSGGAILWQRSFLSTANIGGDQNNTLGATSIGVVTSADVGSTDISPSIGITGTPVIDPTTNILYVCVATREIIGGATYFVQRLHAINISDGADAAIPYLIGATTNGNTNNTQIYVYGSGDGAVTDPYNSTGKPVVQFNALTQGQRPGLSLVDGKVYVAWASHGDNGPYHGWVVAWDVSHIATTGFKLAGVLNTSPNNGGAGIWESGDSLAFEPDGSAFYFVTGNGDDADPAPTLGSNGLPTNAEYDDAVVKVVADPASTPTSENPNGWGMKVADFFIPYDAVALNVGDLDFGSGGILLLPAAAGIAAHANLMIVGGKDGRVFVLDRDSLGGYNSVNDSVVNSVPDGSGNDTAPIVVNGDLSTAAYFNGEIYLVTGYSGSAYAFTLGPTGTLAMNSQTSASDFGDLPGSIVVSADGGGNGIAWIMDRNTNEIHAYATANLATELWNSGQAPGDAVGSVVKFAVPTIANGQVYVGSSDGLVVYGQRVTAVPEAPVLTAADASASAINLAWTDSSPASGAAGGYAIEESIDGVKFTQVATAAAGQSSLVIRGLAGRTTYYFRIRGFNAAGDSAYSNLAHSTTSVLPAPWSDADIGSPTLAGSASLHRSTWVVAGGGDDIWGSADQFHFVSQDVSGNRTMVACVTAIAAADPWAKAGVMFRADADAGSAFVDVVATAGSGVSFQWRSGIGAAAASINLSGVPAPTAAKPLWLKLVKTRNRYQGYYSSDGVAWKLIGSTRMSALPSSAFLAGLAVTAHDNSALNIARFANVALA